MAVYLSLGSNLGERHQHLRRALRELSALPLAIDRVSPLVESPALLPPEALPEWNRPFLNLVAECQTSLSPAELLAAVKPIEQQLGRDDARRWSPRPIDIDILLYDDLVLADETLRIPHPEIARRAFVLTPLAALSPSLRIPGTAGSALELATALGGRIPLWMGIVNLTPDSFSDGGEHASWPAVEATIDRMIAAGVHLVDFGAESTRPGARPLTPDEEWARLEPTLERVIGKLAGDPLRPRIGVDTYHPEVARRAVALGVDLINDVGGLSEAKMIELAGDAPVDFVAMHNLGLPADPSTTLPTDRNAADQVEAWLDRQRERWHAAGLDSDRIVFDPGIGFGKNPLQSLEILRAIGRFSGKGLRLLVGHSRKSFMRGLSGDGNAERDLVTIGASLALVAGGVDILRVHNVVDHALAYRGWSQLQPMD